jgi:phage terminase large subunit-like protein
LKVKATQQHPIRWPKNQMTRVVAALKSLFDAIVMGEMTHDGSSALTRHVLAARMVHSRSGIQIAKEHPASDRKIDAAVAAVLAYQARLDAVAAGLGTAPARRVPRRIR